MPLTFQNPAALFALPLVAGPLLIHLWSRRRFQDEPWGAIDFLLRAVAARARRMWLEQILLLILRTLVLLLLVLAFADPRPSHVSTGGDAVHAPQPALHLFVLDGSYSMQATTDGVRSWDRAKQLAKTMIETSNEGDGFLVAVMSHETTWAVREISFAPAAVVAALDELQPQDTPAVVLPALESIRDRLGEGTGTVEFDRIYVHWITDLEHETWRDVATPSLQSAWRRLARNATNVLHTVPLPERENYYCRDLIAQPGMPLVNEPVTVTANLVNTQTAPIQVEASFYESGKLLDQRSVMLPARGDTTVSFTTSWDRRGEMPLEVRLGDDILTVDNRRYLVVPVRRAIRVLCVEGLAGNSRWVKLALTAGGDRFDVTSAPQAALQSTDGQTVDVVLLLDPRPLTAASRQQIGEWLKQGKGVVVAWGSQTDPRSWRSADVKWLPATPTTVAPLGDYRIDPLDYRHQLVEPFRGNEQAGLRSVPIWKYVKIKPAPDSQTALALGNGDPLVVERRVGRGRVLAVAVPLEGMSLDHSSNPPTPWSALPVWPSFVPLVHQLVRQATMSAGDVNQIDVAEPLRGSIPYAQSIANPVLLLPDGRRERLELQPDPPWWKWQADGSSRSGWAQVQWQEGRPQQWFAVNISPSESRLERFPERSLPSTLLESTSWRDPRTAVVRPTTTWYRTALLTLLALLIVESTALWTLAAKEG